jgi:ketosteroid isomerase-like protein
LNKLSGLYTILGKFLNSYKSAGDFVMKNSLFFQVIIIIISIYQADTVFGKNVMPLIDKANNGWKQTINQNIKDIGNRYTDKAMVFLENGETITGTESIAGYYQNKIQEFGKIINIIAKKRIEIIENYEYYEIGYYTTDKKETFQHLLEWHKANNKWLRKIEVIAKKTASDDDLIEILNARYNWIDLYKELDLKKLYTELYTENAVFYHNEFITHGISNVADTYLARATHDYTLNLSAKATSKVRNDLVFEIGEYQGSYSGNYLFIWKKQSTGEWKIILDVNQIILN